MPPKFHNYPRAEGLYRRLTGPLPEPVDRQESGLGPARTVTLTGDWFLDLPPEASEMVATAARDLRRFLVGALGVRLPTVSGTAVRIVFFLNLLFSTFGFC